VLRLSPHRQATSREQKVFLSKMNLTLVYVLKNEWPHNWPEFISEIVSASTTNEVRDAPQVSQGREGRHISYSLRDPQPAP